MRVKTPRLNRSATMPHFREMAAVTDGGADANLDAIEAGLARVKRQQGNIAETLAMVEKEDAREPLVARLWSLSGERKV